MKQGVDYFEVWNEEQLIEAFERKEDYIVIKGDYNQEIVHLASTKLTDTELLGLELGSSGLIHIFAEVIYSLINTFSKQTKIKKKLEEAMRQYNVKLDDEKQLILYLRQFDY